MEQWSNSNRASSFFHRLFRRPRGRLNREFHLLLEAAHPENLHGLLARDKSALTQSSRIVRTGVEPRLEIFQIHDFVDDVTVAREAAELRLAADERRLPAFETEPPALARASLLPLGAPTGCHAAAGSDAARDALPFANRTRRWTEGMEHEAAMVGAFLPPGNRETAQQIVECHPGMHLRFAPRLLVCSLLFLTPGELLAQTATSSPHVTRAEAAMILLSSRLPEIPTISNPPRFADVAPDAWYANVMAVAERYGLLTVDARTRALKPNASVSRAEFLKMLTVTFGLEQNLPYHYTDVPKGSWFAAYAGVAERYALFRDTGDPPKLHPTSLMTHRQVGQLIEKILLIQDEKRVGPSRAAQAAIARKQSALKLTLYLRLSNTQERATAVNRRLRLREERVTAPSPPAPTTSTSTDLPTLREEVRRLVNSERAAAGLRPVMRNRILELSAQSYAEEMASRGFFGHVTPEGETLRQRIESSVGSDRLFQNDCHCIEKFILGENIARGQKTPAKVMNDWMNSASHKAVILNPSFTDLGVGIVAGVWVQHFGGSEKQETIP